MSRAIESHSMLVMERLVFTIIIGIPILGVVLIVPGTRVIMMGAVSVPAGIFWPGRHGAVLHDLVLDAAFGETGNMGITALGSHGEGSAP